MRRVGVEEQAVAGGHAVEIAPVAINDLALEHVEKLHALMLEGGEDVRVLGKRDQVGFDHDAARVGTDMAEQVVLMAGACTAPLDVKSFASLDEDGAALLLEPPKKGGYRHAQRARQRLQGRQRRRGDPVLDLG